MRNLLANCPAVEPGRGQARAEGDCQLGRASLAQGSSRLDAILRQLPLGCAYSTGLLSGTHSGTWKVPLSPTVDRWYFFCVCVEGVGEWW